MQDKKPNLSVAEIITKIKARFMMQHNYVMDDWFAIMIYEINKRFVESSKKIEEINLQNTNALAKGIEELKAIKDSIKGTVKPIHFSSERQAIKYALAIYAFPTLALILLSSVLIVLYMHSASYQQEKVFFDTHPNLSHLSILKKNIELTTNQKGEKFLILKAKKNGQETVVGKDAYYDKKSNLIFVPLNEE